MKSGPFAPTCHRDGSVTYWSVYSSRWEKARHIKDISDDDYASMTRDECERVLNFLGKVKPEEWNTYAIEAYIFQVGDDPRACGGVHKLQVKRTRAGYYWKRIVDSNGTYQSPGKPVQIDFKEGERLLTKLVDSEEETMDKQQMMAFLDQNNMLFDAGVQAFKEMSECDIQECFSCGDDDWKEMSEDERDAWVNAALALQEEYLEGKRS